ncbi:MAG: DNA recombination protein RmuC [Chloroflexota bacterium]
MDSMIIGIGVIAIVVLLLVVISLVVSFTQARRSQNSAKEQAQILQNLIQALQQEQSQIAVLGEKMAHIEPVVQTTSNLQADLRGLGERIRIVEDSQAKVYQGVGYLANNALSTFGELKTLTGGLSEATAAMRSELTRAKNDLTELHTHAKTEQELDRQIAESVRRLETIIAGTQTKGAAGENLLEAVFSKLPVDWQVRNFVLAGKTVEFGLRLPNRLIVPIDSKWTATGLIEQLISTDEPQDQVRIKREIENAVLQKAKEVRKYIDPSITMNFGIAVVPDAVYDLCASIHVDVFAIGVVLLSYSMLVPYLLLMFQTVLKTNQNIDLQKLAAYLQTTQSEIQELQEEIDGRLSRAIVMIGNSRDDMRIHLSKLSGGLTGIQVSGGNALPESLELSGEN